MKKKEISEIF
jgi:hypothetical protein